ncbi:Methylase involved in ubiquinone/menaquinone biosynthesis [Candidatus Zixiibacteriota bacterium]|nr:Methylase involved in ubiquinone/menaquinone biosynthesis [candidate division Zixibacteria bacterium]
MATHICPWWMGYFLISPWRRRLQNPEKILSPYIKSGIKILEIGPGMGFFTLSMARMVGDKGRIFAVDVQQKMLASLEKRAAKAGLKNRIMARPCSPTSLEIDDLSGTIDFAVAFAVMHEIPDQKAALESIMAALKPGGTLLISEPGKRVTRDEFQKTVSLAENCGFKKISAPQIKKNHSIDMIKPER